MPALNAHQNAYFNSTFGAFSPISELDEAKKRQITCTDEEYQILVNHFGIQNLHIGPVNENRTLAVKNFFNDNSGEMVELPLTFPKEGKNELRLYMSSRNNFAPQANDIWYLYKRNDENFLHIGFIKPDDWQRLSGGIVEAVNIIVDDTDDEIYQNNLQNVLARMPATTTVNQYPRSSAVARNAVERAHGQCEVDRSHETFTTAAGANYIEAHHLMPISQQNRFEYSLDHPANIIILCPNCHRKIHYGNREARLTLIQDLYARRSQELVAQGIQFTIEDLRAAYRIP